MKLGKIISLLFVLYFCLKVLENILYVMHHPARNGIILISHGILTYFTIPLLAIWFYKNSDNKKGTK
jgi:hypothetical protein